MTTRAPGAYDVIIRHRKTDLAHWAFTELDVKPPLPVKGNALVINGVRYSVHDIEYEYLVGEMKGYNFLAGTIITIFVRDLKTSCSNT